MHSIRLLMKPALTVLGLIVFLGCSVNRDADLPPTISVSGVVTYQGKPVPDASIMFYPTEGRKPATGKADASGKFELSTFGKNDGVLAGEHKVTVNAYQTTSEGVSMKSAIPVKYTNPSSTPLVVNVSESENEIELKLVD
ncbi:carboxypeptidase-like regulatory domain-containing protein [uncultured Gimesia sp.]|uniref:carboxypeptidase-like regulatory domain-containing protein n=1 Tax=uncultured Gimesia sp. TaxID=1678688 RepID=UPI0026293557|nr:carboxypeptidase-like regulatory domain-containing protein [uncultured Gimesia sp.]